ncbi:hypothetical protein ABD91_25660 [Lysinibacillus sphaericus]|uniref:hypothetical protein n=1 Tax=Lysinibacillus sphaericus TaxID=1421 RepID=UPI0018CDB9CC|nr:hypothetical protein [Lysinibacillus sphaericus]MBG9694131.1 hypothetical protein [Lysinibacillus sphaericus]
MSTTTLDQKIAKKVIESIENNMPILSHELEKRYNTQNLIDYVGKLLEEYIDEINKSSTYAFSVNSSYQRQKKSIKTNSITRYFSYIKDPNSINLNRLKNIELIELYIEMYNTKDTIIRTQRVLPKKFDEFVQNEIKKKIVEIERWESDKSELFVNYIFFDKFSKKTQDKYVKKDLEFILINLIRSDFIDNATLEIERINDEENTITLPLSIVQNNQTSSDRATIELSPSIVNVDLLENDNPTESIKTDGYISVNKLNNFFYPETYITTRQEISDIDTNQKSSILEYGLRPDDLQLLTTVNSFNTKNFIENKINSGPIIVPIEELREKYYPNSKYTKAKHLTSIFNSLNRLTNIALGYRHDRLNQLAIGNLPKSETYFRIITAVTKNIDVEGNLESLNIYLSPFIYDELASKKTVSLYGDYAKKLKGAELSYSFPLQLRRLTHHAAKVLNVQNITFSEKYDESLSLSFFRAIHVLKYPKFRYIHIVKNALETLKDNNLIIQDYDFDVTNNSFLIKYLPVSDREYEEFNNNEIAPVELRGVLEKINTSN